MTTLFHIAESSDWEKAIEVGVYKPAGFDREGFIHLSTGDQVMATAKRYYSGRHGLVLLEIEDAGVRDMLRFEPSPSGELFPHLYGVLPVEQIKSVHTLIPEPDGTFSWPVSPHQLNHE